MRIETSYRSIMIALAVLAGTGTLAACGSSRADEPYIATRCNETGDHCWQVRCNDQGEDCYPINYSDSPRDNGYGRRSWVCDEDGSDCHWVYGDASDQSDR